MEIELDIEGKVPSCITNEDESTVSIVSREKRIVYSIEQGGEQIDYGIKGPSHGITVKVDQRTTIRGHVLEDSPSQNKSEWSTVLKSPEALKVIGTTFDVKAFTAP